MEGVTNMRGLFPSPGAGEDAGFLFVSYQNSLTFHITQASQAQTDAKITKHSTKPKLLQQQEPKEKKLL